MRTFVVLCLVTAVAAQYKYGIHTGGSVGGEENYSGGIGAPAQNDYSAPAVVADNEYDKEFFTFSAPESEFVDTTAADKIAAVVKKNLRVVFIKGPDNSGLENAALQLAKTVSNDRTAIYVLNKQTDIAELADKLNVVNKNSNSRPEVHFVKYRTPADADNAQRIIQAEYDALPGKSSTTNGGAAHVLDFSSKATVGSTSPSRSRSNPTAADSPRSIVPPQTSYLPPSRRI